MVPEDFVINGIRIAPGERVTIDLPTTKLYTHTPMSVPVQIIHSKKPGPRMFVSAAIHGDEINGVEIIRRLLKLPTLRRLRGTLVAIPIVNVHGLVNRSRYLPDRRDLNRNFPGSERGSLAARLANLFMTEIVEQCTHGIDLHTGASGRANLPQIRANLDDEQTLSLANKFGVPVLLNADLRDGSLRQAASELGLPMLLYEAGEALRFDEVPIRAGVKGIVNVMRELEMLPQTKRKPKNVIMPMVARSNSWVRASDSGIFRAIVPLGARVDVDQVLGIIADPFGEQEQDLKSPVKGIVIGRSNLPLVNEGEALFNIARFAGVAEIAAKVEQFQEVFEPDTESETESDADSPII